MPELLLQATQELLKWLLVGKVQVVFWKQDQAVWVFTPKDIKQAQKLEFGGCLGLFVSFVWFLEIKVGLLEIAQDINTYEILF